MIINNIINEVKVIDREKQLEKLHHLNKATELLKEQIYSFELEITKDSVVGSSVNFPYTQHVMVISGIEDYNKKLERLQLRLADKIVKLLDTVETLTDYIEVIPDSE